MSQSINDLKESLIQKCLEFKMNEHSEDNFDKYPYIPYIPNNWNGILVLAESQQLRGNNDGNLKYVNNLREYAPDDKNLISRLGNTKINNEGGIGISPWDEGYIPLAMMSCFPDKMLNEFGVANAVPWHLDKSNRKQENDYIRMAKDFWEIVIPMLVNNGLHTVIRTGTYARDILNYNSLKKHVENVVYIRSASQLERDAWLFNENDLLKRYPEIVSAIEKSGSIWNSSYHIFYAAHAVSKLSALNK